jgi:hypothetical protein
MAVPSPIPQSTNTDNKGLFPSISEESYTVLMELDSNSDRLYEYFLEQPSTKELMMENDSLNKANIEQARANLDAFSETKIMLCDLQSAITELEQAKQELQSVKMLCDEIDQQYSFEAVMFNLKSDLATEESQLSSLMASLPNQDNISYSEAAKSILRHCQRIQELRFDKAWIERNII